MELSRPPLVIAFELSEKRKAIVADALAGASTVVYLTELDEAASAEALRKVGKRCARRPLGFLLWRRACRLFGDGPFLDLCILFTPYGQKIGTAGEPVVHWTIELAERQSWDTGSKTSSTLPRSPDRSAQNQNSGIEPWACDHAAAW